MEAPKVPRLPGSSGGAGADPGRARRGIGGASEPGSADVRVALLVGDLRRRLQPACQDWDAAEFEALLQQIARTKVRWSDAGYGD